VAGLQGPALRLSSGVRSGAPAAVLGYPLDGGYDAEPARAGNTERVSTQDAYGNGPVVRSILSLRGRVRPGNSGGPLVSTSGQVLGTVFAAVTGGGPRGGFAVPNPIVRAQLARARHQTQPVDNGPCAS
jgi:S1-C subfamily serine protease